MGYPMLDPERDLNGATPEKLAQAPLRPIHRWRRDGASVAREGPGAARQPVGAIRSR